MATSARIGRYLIGTLQDHESPERDPGQVYKDVPASAWTPYRSFALNENGKYRSQWRGHLIRPAAGGGPYILVDTGMGPGPHQHTGRAGEFLHSLAGEGVKPEQINVVVITHCHGDHIGWSITWNGDSPLATFPNATYYIAANDWEHYSRPENANEAFNRSVRPLKNLGRLQLVSGETDIADGIRTLPANGHTPGHQCVLVGSEEQIGVLTGDLFHNVAQITEQTWCPVFDWNTTMSRASRQSVLGRAQKEGWLVFSGHLPIGRSIGRVVLKNGRPEWRHL
ncbi:MAG: MBL fold metallo-hydrolase [Chloroflexi bacterium]|nr:MBL fold metallo-hydrolase [Chloroflexota bacterium]